MNRSGKSYPQIGVVLTNILSRGMLDEIINENKITSSELLTKKLIAHKINTIIMKSKDPYNSQKTSDTK